MRALKSALTLLVALTLTLSAGILPVMADPVAGAAPGVSSLTLDKSAVQLTMGDEGVLITATVSPRSEGAKVQWSSSDKAVVSVAVVDNADYPGDAQILVRAKQAGTATITAKIDQLTATCQVRVESFMVIFFDTNGDSMGSRMGNAERKVTPPDPPDLGEHAHFIGWYDDLIWGNPVDFKKPITGKTNFYPHYTFDEGWVLLRAKLTHVKNAALFPKMVKKTSALLAFQFRPEPGYQFPEFIPVTTINDDGTINTLQEGRDYTYEYVSGAFAIFPHHIPFSVTITGFVPKKESTTAADKAQQVVNGATQLLLGSVAGSIQGLPGVSQSVTNNGTKLDVIQMPLVSGGDGIGGSLITLLGQSPNTVALRFDIHDNLSSGSASVLMPGGFGAITELGRIGYSMDYSATAPHEKEILALMKDTTARYDTMLVGGNYVLPGKATVTLSTDLPANSAVAVQHYDPKTNNLTFLSESRVDEYGRVPLDTSILGELVIVQP